MPVTTSGTGSRGALGGGRKMAQRPICVCDEMQELYEIWYSLCLAPRREQVVSQMILVVLPPVVQMASAWSQKRNVKNNLFAPPSSRSNPRPYENPGTKEISCTCCTYCVTTCCNWDTIAAKTQTHCRTHFQYDRHTQRNSGGQEGGKALHCG
jgi:hypothetical protein